MKLRSVILISSILVLCLELRAQVDSTILIPDLLAPSDILPISNNDNDDQQVISLYGKPISVKELPFPAYVITEEDILKNGYVTLTDALRMVPGMFVSPLGSATEGELFMMHGLRGNRMAQILINGVSIRPELAAGMPLGSQVPIRQAERIEIIFGAGMASAGIGANAGIINIVLKESERPVYTQADLSIGDLGYNNIDVMFGGKLGRGKRILKFSAWGSNTTIEDWFIGYPLDRFEPLQTVYIPSNYNHYYNQPRYIDNLNYAGSSNYANKDRFPHESRQFGLSFRFGLFEIMGTIHDRKDHIALGLNPLHVNYSNPVNFKGETISKVSFSKKAGNRKLKFSFESGIQQLLIDQQSSANYIESYVGNAFEQSILRSVDNPTSLQLDNLVTLNRVRHFNGKKFFGGIQYDLNLNLKFSYPISSKYTVILGQASLASFGDTEKSYLLNPIRDEKLYADIFQSNFNGEFGNGGQSRNRQFTSRTYMENQINLDKLYLNLGFQFPLDRLIQTNYQLDLYPRIGANYRISDKINIKSSYIREGSHISDYLREQTYAFDTLGVTYRLNTVGGITTQNARWREIITENFNLGMNFSLSDNLNISLGGFANSTKNLPRLNTTIRQKSTEPDSLLVVGYLNDRPFYNKLLGLQAQIVSNDVFGVKGFNMLFSGMVMRATEHTFEDMTEASFEDLVDYPSLIMQLRLSYNSDSWYFGIENILQKETRSAAHLSEVTLGGLITDATVRYRLSRNFEIYSKAMNLFNTTYSGVSAAQTPDALLYNIQPLQRFRLGVTYRM